MIQAVDVHCHVHSEEFDPDRHEVLARAGRRGINVALTMGEGHDDNLRAMSVARQHRPGADSAGSAAILPCLGLHPDRAGEEEVEPVVAQIRDHAGELAAIGETGLDYWIAREDDQRRQQRDNLLRLIELARELDLPLSVHSRSAGHHVIDLLERSAARRICLHAFDGGAKHAVRAAALGYYLSIPPSVLRSQQKQKLVRRVPLESLLLETDSPVLGPDRQARNEPANITFAADKIAEIKGCPIEEVLAVTTRNARELFRLDRWG